MSRRIYKTMQGREVDMDSLLQKNEKITAVGNVRMNARGDELGSGGKVLRTREEIVSQYYQDNQDQEGNQ